MSLSNHELQDKFMHWLRLPEAQRGDIRSIAEWGRRHGVTDRTLRRWKNDPELLERAQRPAAPATSPSPEPTSGDEADYQVVKAALVEGAKGGNPKYLEMYLRTYGKPFIEEEVASRATDLSGMDLDELVARAVSTLSPTALETHLRSIGWTVQRP
jgi:hypothetical protein